MIHKYIRNYCLNGIEKPIFFEIGSADGLDTLKFINTFNDFDFKLYCFEPYPKNIALFKERVNDKRVTLFEGVLSDTNGYVDFYMPIDNNLYSGSLREPSDLLYEIWNFFKKGNSFEQQRVKSITMDSFAEENQISQIDFVWMDVQGAEDIVIKGGKNSFKYRVRYLYTEYSDNEIYHGQPKLMNILEMLDLYEIVQDWKNISGDLLGGDVLLRNILAE